MKPTLDVSRGVQSTKQSPSPDQTVTTGQLSPTGQPQITHLHILLRQLAMVCMFASGKICPVVGSFQFMMVISRRCLPLVSSCAAAGIPGGQEEAVHQSSSAGQAEEWHRAGQDFVPHRQKPGPHDPGCPGGHRRGHQHSERCYPSEF